MKSDDEKQTVKMILNIPTFANISSLKSFLSSFKASKSVYKFHKWDF